MRSSSHEERPRWIATLVMSLLCLATLLVPTVVRAAASPQQKCQAGKNLAAGRYASCTAKALKGYVMNGDADRYAAALLKCEDKLVLLWDRLEFAATAAGGSCPSEADRAPIEGFVDACVQSVAGAVGGGPLPTDVIACNTDLATCSGELAACSADLGTCEAEPRAQAIETGQTDCWDPQDTILPIDPIVCDGSGQDGDFGLGVAFAYVDNDDGTITDVATGLMWEKLDDSNLGGSAGIHDADNTYTWAGAFAKIADLNLAGFAGYGDWRVPNIRELDTLKDYGRSNPATPPAFETGCVADCTVATCSCTRSFYHWSSSSYQGSPNFAWLVHFSIGGTEAQSKTATHYVRAVRGGF